MAMAEALEVRTLEEWRRLRGMESREQLAAATRNRVSASTIGRIERGELKTQAERRTREDLADALGVSVEQIRWP